MGKVIDEFKIGKYRSIILDQVSKKSFSKLLIDGIEMDPIMSYPVRENQFSVMDTGETLLGKNVEFI